MLDAYLVNSQRPRSLDGFEQGTIGSSGKQMGSLKYSRRKCCSCAVPQVKKSLLAGSQSSLARASGSSTTQSTAQQHGRLKQRLSGTFKILMDKRNSTIKEDPMDEENSEATANQAGDALPEVRNFYTNYCQRKRRA